MWVHGPPGSGKTSLVASYARARRLTTAWHRMDPFAEDPETFAADLERAVSPSARRNGGGRSGDARSALRRLFRNLAAASVFPDLLVLDGFAGRAAGSPLAAALAAAIEDVPASSSLLVVSRELPSSAFARLRLNGEMRLVGWPDLGLTAAEARALARSGGGSAPEPVIDGLRHAARGWISGFRLLLRQANGRGLASRGEASRLLHDYFAAETFARIPRETRALLARSALPPRFTLRVFEGLGANGNGAEILEGLRRQHLFLEEPSPGVYEYHELFRTFLLARPGDAFRGEDPSALRRRAAELLSNEGLLEEAFELYLEIRAWPEMAMLLGREASRLAATGLPPPLDSRLRDLPDEAADAEPNLAWWRGTRRLPTAPESARRDFESAFVSSRGRGDDTGAARAWCGVVESFLHEWSDFTGLDPWLGILADVTRMAEASADPALQARVSTSAFAALLFRRPADPQLRAYLASAVEQITHAGVSPAQRVSTLLHAAFHAFWIGDMGRATIVLDRLDAESRGRSLAPLAAVVRATLEAIRAWLQGDATACRTAVEEGLRLAEETGAHAWDYQLLGQGVYAGLLLEDEDVARSFLERMRAVLREERRLDASHFHYLSALVSRAEGNRPASLGHAERAFDLAREAGTPFPQALNHVLLADLAIAEGRHVPARRHLAAARRIARGMGSRILAYTCDWSAASLALSRGRREAFRRSLRRALALGAREGFGVLPWMSRDTVARLLDRGLSEDIDPANARHLVEIGHLVPPGPDAPVTVWPRPVEIFALGRFEVRRAGRPLKFGRKVQKKPLELLKALVAFGGREVPAQRVGDVLWPELDGAAARHALTTTLHRLRQLVGCDQAIVLHEGRLSLDPERCWVDVYALEHVLDEVLGRGEAAEPDPGADRTAVERALNLYRGDLLEGEREAVWGVSARERLRSKFLRFVLRAGEAEERAGAHQRAIDLYLRGLEVDGLAEDLYARLVAAYARLGRRAEALGAYERCRRTLEASLGIEPSERLETLRRNLTKKS